MALPTDTAPAAAASRRNGGVREVFSLAAPVVLTQLSTTLMGVVDSAMVGRLGATELAAVGFASIWTWTIFSFLHGTASGVQTFVSQADGAGRQRECGAWAWQGVYTVVPAAVLFVAVLAPAIPTLMSWLGPSPELQSAATSYVVARMPGEVGVAFAMALISFFRGFGDTRTPLYAALFANALNAVLDYGLIFGELGLPAWGVKGAGVATAIGNWSTAVWMLLAFRRRKVSERFDTRRAAPDAAAVRRFLRTSLPIGGHWCVSMMSFAVFTTVVARMGDTSMAASQAFVMLLSLSFMQAVGISVAAMTLVGQYVGREDPEGVRRAFRSSLVLGGVVSGVIGALFILAPAPLLRIFTDDPSVVALGLPLMLLGALFQIFDAVAIVVEGALHGAGDTRWPFVVETILGWGLLIPLAYVMGVTLEGGLRGAWIAALIHIALLAGVLLYRFRSGAWQGIRI